MNRLFFFTVALLGCVLLGGCSGAAAPEGADAGGWHTITLIAREGVAVLQINDDEVVLESVPFEGTISLLGQSLKARGFVHYQSPSRGVSMRGVTSGTLVISIGEKSVTLSQDCEQVEFDGHRARLEGGAKRVVFARDGTVEVSDLK